MLFFIILKFIKECVKNMLSTFIVPSKQIKIIF